VGLDSRDYMNEDAGAGPSRGLLSNISVSNQLILVNVVVWLAWQVWRRGDFLHDHFMVSAQGVLDGHRVWTLLTYAVSHIEPFHLLVNMLFLYWFGNDLERVVGRRNLGLIYVVGAIAGAAAQLAFNVRQLELRATPMLGASAAVMAIVLTTTLLTPWKRVLIWGVIPAPLWTLAAVFVAVDLVGVARQVVDASVEHGFSRVGYAGHLGGALAGVVFKLIDLRASPRRLAQPASATPWSWLATAWRRRKLRVLPPLRDDERAAHADEAEHAPPPSALRRVDPETEARVDDLLRKINREGLDSLTVEEKRFLEHASSQYRR
jgi:membrane associated rhomboid family serine protease